MSKGSARRPAAERGLYQKRYAKIDWGPPENTESITLETEPPGPQGAIEEDRKDAKETETKPAR